LQASVDKIPLDLKKYEKYGIDQQYSAFEMLFKNINQNEADTLEDDYFSRGYKIFHTEMSQNSDGSFDLTMIVASLAFTF